MSFCKSEGITWTRRHIYRSISFVETKNNLVTGRSQMDKIDEFTLRPLYKLKGHPEDQKAI